ncbi:hypothetical protein ACFLVD_00575 [Chloroflexota bacterium]
MAELTQLEKKQARAIKFKIVIVCLAILILASFWGTMGAAAQPLSLAVVPEVPREGEPVIVTFKLYNPSPETTFTEYEFYANGKLLEKGGGLIPPGCSKQYQYAYENTLKLGEQVNFVVNARSGEQSWEKVRSLPAYPPQVWSSFVSFASFSTSVMGFMTTMTYYDSTFGVATSLNVGLICALVLIALLIYLEMTRPALMGKTVAALGRLHLRFGTITWILFIIFIGMVYTRVAMLLAM